MGRPLFEISKDFMFSAAHQVRFHKGKCERLHGHNYRIRVHVQSSELNAIGMVLDFADLYQAGAVLCERYDTRFLNEQIPFDVVNPTAENVARVFYDEMSAAVRKLEGERVWVSLVEVYENDKSLATYREV